MGFERNRDRNRFQPRVEPASTGEQPTVPEIATPVGLPAFITAPPAIAVSTRPGPLDVEAPAAAQHQAPDQEQEGAGFNLASRRRRRPRPIGDEPRENDKGGLPPPGELPLGD
jgi:hypothetical protein